MAKIYILPYLRKGLSCNITSSGKLIQQRATLKIDLGVDLNNAVSNTVENRVLEGQIIQLMGPADVKSLKETSVNLISPVENSQVKLFKEYLPFIEFYEEDLPWRYTPVATADEDFHPWMVLIAVKESEFESIILSDATKVAMLNITSQERFNEIFPNKDLLSKVGHVQIESDIEVNKSNVDSLLEDNPDCGLSRILCTSKLDTGENYVALLIPSYETGRLAALGEDITSTPLGQRAWDDTLDGQNLRPQGLVFPYYKRWKFSTSSNKADFKELASLLTFTSDQQYSEMKATLDVDITNTGIQYSGIEKDSVIDVPAALTLDGSSTPLRTESEEYTNALKELLDLNPVFAENASGEINMEEDPWVVPPVYGARHKLTTSDEFSKSSSDVVSQVNLKLKNRIAAGMGSMVVNKNQETFVNRAWKKVEKINQLNQTIREYYQMMQVDEKASAKHSSKALNVKVTIKNKALMMDVAQRSLQTSSIYRGQVSSDTLLDSSKSMTKPVNQEQPVKYGLTVDQLLGLYSEDLWKDILQRKEVRNRLACPDKLNFYELFSDYDILDTLGFGVQLNSCNKFQFTSSDNQLKGSLPLPDALLYRNPNLFYLLKAYFGSDIVSLLYGKSIHSLVNSVSNVKPLFDRFSRLGTLQILPVTLTVGNHTGIVVNSTKGIEKISGGKPIAVEYYDGTNLGRFYIIPSDYLKKNNNACYNLTMLQTVLSTGKSSLISPVSVDLKYSNGKFNVVGKAPGNEISPLWYRPTESANYQSLKKIRDILKELSPRTMKQYTPYRFKDNLRVYLSKSFISLISIDGFKFFFSLTEKCFNKVITVSGKNLIFEFKAMAAAIETILEGISKIENLLWEPTQVKIPAFSSDSDEIVVLRAEDIVSNGSLGEFGMESVTNLQSVIKESNELIKKELQMELTPDENMQELDTEGIDVTDIANKRIEEILEKYGYTEDNQLKENLDSKYPVMAYPDFLEPTYFYLRELSKKYITPSAGLLQKNSITYFHTNNEFEESFLMGMNTEMGKELLWREYPTDQRGSYFRKFWDQTTLPSKGQIDKYYDVKPLHLWENNLGKNHMEGKEGMLVFAICGQLMQTYPNTTIYLSVMQNNKLVMKKAAEMTSWLDEQTYLVGFSGVSTYALQGYYLTFEQQPLSLQFERSKGSNSINNEFAVVTPQIYAIPLKNRK